MGHRMTFPFIFQDPIIGTALIEGNPFVYLDVEEKNGSDTDLSIDP